MKQKQISVTLPKETWEDLLRSLRGPAGDLISPGTIKNFEHAYQRAKVNKDSISFAEYMHQNEVKL
jgi:hypothetical protein